MRALFPHRLYTQRLFCRRCRRVTNHGLFAKEPYSTYGGMSDHIPLFCICDECDTTFICFSHEFEFGKKFRGTEYAKVYGRNRITPGNWIYFKGAIKPGVVKSFFQSGDREVVVVDYGSGAEQKFEGPKITIDREEAPDGYRLVPAQTPYVLFGDHVYHTIRDQFGVAVGLVTDAGKDKLVIMLDDQSLLFITIPQTVQNLPNDKLSELVWQKLRQLFPEDSRRISITVGQGIVYLDGLVKNLAVKRALCACVNSMPRVRGCVDFMRVQMETYISDERLESAIYNLIETHSMKIFNYEVSVKDSKATVRLCCTDENFPKDLETRIANLTGLQDLTYEIESVPEASLENRGVCQIIETDLANAQRLSGCVIRISYFHNKYLIEGHVSNAFQRQWAFINTLKVSKTSAIDNKLRIC